MTDEEVQEIGGLVRGLVRGTRLPEWLEYEDVEQDVWLRLVSGTYDAGRGVPWEAYLAQRIRWAIRDSIRGSYPRGGRRKQVRWERVEVEDVGVEDDRGYRAVVWRELIERVAPGDRRWCEVIRAGGTQREVARRRGLSEAAVSLWWARLIRRWRQWGA